MSASQRGGKRPGAGRPPGSGVGPDGAGQRVQVYLPIKLRKRLDAQAKRDGLSRSAALVEAIRAYLAD